MERALKTLDNLLIDRWGEVPVSQQNYKLEWLADLQLTLLYIYIKVFFHTRLNLLEYRYDDDVFNIFISIAKLTLARIS